MSELIIQVEVFCDCKTPHPKMVDKIGTQEYYCRFCNKSVQARMHINPLNLKVAIE